MVAAPTVWYVNGLRTCLRAGTGIAGVTGTLKFMLLHDTYILDQDNHDFVDDVSAHEASGTGYSAGGLTVASPSVTTDAATNEARLFFTSISGISVASCYGILYVSTGTPSTSPLLTCTDFSAGDAVDQIVTSGVVGSTGFTALTAV